ncbi:MAG: hypothetical protein GF405_03625 [Candidatus Eisenbacteria bacterium]|nr:hypothetical protein [Candidatus Eisenbacteria bacterium]
MLLAVRIILAIVYFLAGLALFWGRRRLVEEGRPPNLVVPAVLLLLAGLTTLIR